MSSQRSNHVISFIFRNMSLLLLLLRRCKNLLGRPRRRLLLAARGDEKFGEHAVVLLGLGFTHLSHLFYLLLLHLWSLIVVFSGRGLGEIILLLHLLWGYVVLRLSLPHILWRKFCHTSIRRRKLRSIYSRLVRLLRF